MPKLLHANVDVVVKMPQTEETTLVDTQRINKKTSAYIQIQSGEHLGRIVPLNKEVMQVGKTGSNKAIITRRANNYFLSQIDGDKVTINGLPIGTESILLKDGNLIQMSAIRFKFFAK